jgi:hypothetical protein
MLAGMKREKYRIAQTTMKTMEIGGWLTARWLAGVFKQVLPENGFAVTDRLGCA